MTTPSPFDKYRNPDPRCTYPWEPGPVGYCASYACAVDEGHAVDAGAMGRGV